MKIFFAIIIAFISLSAYTQGSMYYVSNISGNDNHNGLTMQTPWKSISKVKAEMSKLSPGDVVAFKSGEIWKDYLILINLKGNAQNPITFTSYGSGNKPVISAVNKFTHSWKSIGNNIWYTTGRSSTPWRIKMDGKEIQNGAWFSELGKNVSGTSTPNIVKWWWGNNGNGGSYLYLYSKDSPSNHNIELSAHSAALNLKNCDYISLSGLELKGGTAAALLLKSSNYIDVSDCNIGDMAHCGIFTELVDSNLTNVVIDRCNIDSKFTLNYNSAGIYQGSTKLSGTKEGIKIASLVNGEIKNCTITNWSHSNLQMTSGTGKSEVSNVKIFNNTIQLLDNMSYGGAVTFDFNSNNNEFYNNHLKNTKSSQVNGYNNHVHHNIFENTRQSPLILTDAGNGISIQNYGGTSHHNIIENNIIISSDGYGINLSENNKAGGNYGHIIRNNILFNCGKLKNNIAMKIGLESTYPGTLHDNAFENNLIYNSATVNTIKSRNVVMTIANFNLESGFNNNYSNNISGNPLFVNEYSNWRLKNGSPALDAAKTVLAKFDYAGNSIGTVPEIGIYDGGSNNQGGSLTANAGSDVSICNGESTTLTASGGSSYAWSTGATTASISVSPNSTQTYNVTVSDGNASDSDDVVVTVNSVSANAGSDVTINEGDSITLNATGGNSYLWSNGETTQSITVSPTSSLNYTVTVTSNGCDDKDTVRVIVNATTGSVTANAGADVSICDGDNTTLTASGGSSYAWNTGATTESITVSPTSSETYTVTVSDGINSDSDDVLVTVNDVVANAGTDKTINEGDSITLKATGGDSYLWNTGATKQSITISPSSSLDYTVTVTSNGCDDTDTVRVNVNPTTGSVIANAGADVSLCNGESTTLTASGGSSYVWSTGATTPSITVSPNSTSTYTVTVTDGINSDSDEVLVTVVDVVANAGTDKTINEGDSITLKATGGDSYLWSNGETTQSISVSPTATSSYTVTASINGCTDSDSVNVTVNSTSGSVNASAGVDVTICSGENTTLTASGGSTFLWSNGETTESITVSPTSSETYTVTVSDGINSDSDEVLVTVVDVVANAGADKTINEGDSITLKATGGDFYLWSNGETTQSITFSPMATSSYSVTASINGCKDSDSVNVTVNSIDISNPSPVNTDAGEDMTICLGESTFLIGSGGDTYEWSNGESTKQIEVSPTRTTTYTLTATREGESNSDTVTITVENCDEAESIEDKNISTIELLVYPNPTEGELFIRIDNNEVDANLSINDAKGSMIYSEIISGSQENFNRSVNLSRYSTGIYFVRLWNTEQSLNKKVILQ